MNGSDSESWWIILSKDFSIPLKKLPHSEMWYEQLICIPLVSKYIPEMQRHLYRWHKWITQCLNCFCISRLEFECHPLLPALVFFLFTWLLDLPFTVNIYIQNFLYLTLILDSLISCWWLARDCIPSQLVDLNWCRFFWLTWTSLFFCLWIPPYLLPLWWQHWNFL